MGEIVYAAGFLEVFSEQAARINGELIAPTDPNTRFESQLCLRCPKLGLCARVVVSKEPVGVVGAITPWYAVPPDLF